MIKRNYQRREWLHRRYIIEEKSMQDMASEEGVSKVTISKWIKKHGIPIRDSQQAQAVTGRQRDLKSKHYNPLNEDGSPSLGW